MEDLTYVDMFATKGAEYLLVIAYLTVLVLFWKMLNTSSLGALAKSTTVQHRSAAAGWFHLAEGLYFHQGHSWVVPDDGNLVKIGIDDFAQKLLGIPGNVTLPNIGAKLKQGERGWQLQIDSKSIDMLSPVNGKVVEINETIRQSPGLISQDPYQNWLMKVQVSKWDTDLKHLLSRGLARAWMEETVNKLRTMMAGELGPVLQDGGLPVLGFARTLSPERWEEIAREFLLSK